MWQSYGNADWLAFPPKEEPERIILSDTMIDATYRIQLTYVEDCSSLPSALLAGLLGISTDLLIDYFAGGAIPGISGQQIADLISQVCFSHDPSNATVDVYVNGVLIKEATATLQHKGDTLYILDPLRTNGHFTAQ